MTRPGVRADARALGEVGPLAAEGAFRGVSAPTPPIAFHGVVRAAVRARTPRLQWLLLLIALILRFAPGSLADASYALLAAYALLGRSQAVHALGMSWLITMLNPGIAPWAEVSSIARYAVIAGAALSVLARGVSFNRSQVVWRPVLATALLGIFLTLHSLLFSPVVDVSLLKALSWTVVACTVLSAWHGLTAAEGDRLAREVFGGLTAVLLLSLPFLVMSLGYLRNGRGFQGVLNHPQALGTTMALLGIWAASQMVALRRPPWRIVLLVAAAFTLTVLSQSRTAGIALLASAVVAVVIGPLLAHRSARSMLPGLFSRRVYAVFGIAIVGAILVWPFLVRETATFVSKSGAAVNLTSAYDASRGGLIADMWANVQERPLEGIGFGIASNKDDLVVVRDPILGLPSGAAVEKGVAPLAILEELGFIGLGIVSLWVWMILTRSARNGLVPLAVLSVVLMTNLGEATLFSPGGMGLLLLVLVGWAVGSRDQRRLA